MPEIISQRGFETAEFESRLESAQRLMADQGLAGILLTTEAEIRYFSGFQTLFWQSPTRPWFLLLPEAGLPIAVIPEIGAALMRTTWVKDIRSWSAPCPEDDGISLLQHLLAPYAETGSRIGMLKGPETNLRMPLADYERLVESLAGLKIVDATDVIKSLRQIKSAAEIKKISSICDIASRAFGEAERIFQNGQPLIDAFRAFKIECLMQGADDVPYLVGGADQGGYIDVISPPSSRPLENGDILMMDTGSVFDGYFCDFDRNFAIGSADDLSKKAYDVLYRATEAGLKTARPGVTCAELFKAMQSVIDEFGDQDGNVGRMGHGLGMQLTEWPSHAAFDQTVLAENMVITLEPSVGYGDGRIMVHEENVVIRDGEPTLLSARAAPNLPILT
ncbi:MAG: Xaa-Pro peptidase family protein [Sneathiella sp.]|uniref:M24 family metallopeptidase n=1 Tax=Sneathiella sp. TaxID=1964365 RepID=UPI003001DB85